jgi:biotin operon repressor
MVNERVIDPVEILRILDQSSARTVSLSYIAKHFGVRKQSVHKHMKRLFEKGFVIKDERGRYILTEKGKAYLEHSVIVNKMIDEYIKKLKEDLGFTYDDVKKLFEDIYIKSLMSHSAFIFYLLSLIELILGEIYNISLKISERNKDKIAETLFEGWSSDVIESAKKLFAVLIYGDANVWRTFSAYMLSLYHLMLLEITLIKRSAEEYKTRSLKTDEI